MRLGPVFVDKRCLLSIDKVKIEYQWLDYANRVKINFIFPLLK